MSKVVVLVSGGLDSYIAWRIAPDDKKALWVNLGQPYARKEEMALGILGIPAIKVEVANFYPNPITIENSEIPGRNLLLALAAAQHGNEIWISALDGEMHQWTRDKTPEFFNMTSVLFTYILSNLRAETLVTTPFIGKTKTDIVEIALRLGVSQEDLKKTSSCYHESKFNCGVCGTCFKRWIAMTNNDIAEVYGENPWKSPYAIRTRNEMRKILDETGDFSHFSMKRIQETSRALLAIGEKL